MSLPPRMKLKFHSSKDFANLIVPEEISKRTPPLGYVFASFLRKKKGCAGVGCIAPHNKLPVPKNSTHLLGRYERYKPTKSFVKKTGLEPLLQTRFGMGIIPRNII